MPPEPIPISRIEFERQTGIAIGAEMVGVRFYTPNGGLVEHYVFVDDGPSIEWLEKLYKLE